MPILPLKYPFDFGSQKITELVFPERLKAKHMRGAEISTNGKIAVDDMITLLSGATNNPPSLIAELDAEDFVAAGAMVGDFFGSGRRTGKKS